MQLPQRQRARPFAHVNSDSGPPLPIPSRTGSCSATPGPARSGPRGGRPRRHGGVLTFKKPDSRHEPDVTTATDPTRYGTATATARDRMHPRLTHRGPRLNHATKELPVLHGTLIHLKVERLPDDRDPKPAWPWRSATATHRRTGTAGGSPSSAASTRSTPSGRGNSPWAGPPRKSGTRHGRPVNLADHHHPHPAPPRPAPRRGPPAPPGTARGTPPPHPRPDRSRPLEWCIDGHSVISF